MDQSAKNPQVMDQIALLDFVDSLIRERQDANITEKNMAQVRESLLKEINNAVHEHLINKLSDADAMFFDELLRKNPSDEELDNFLQEKVPNIQTEIAATLFNFRTAYLMPVLQEKKPEQSPLN